MPKFVTRVVLTAIFLFANVFLQTCFTEAVLASEAKPIVIAHRGGKLWAPENTMAAFRKALAFGVDAIELDIHRCKSGELVVIHDETIDRTTDGHGLIKDLNFEELQKFSAGLWYDKSFKDEKIPSLPKVLKQVDGKAHIFIEVKNAPVQYPGIEDDLIRSLESYKQKGRITVISFDHEFLKRFHMKAPDYKIAFLDVSIVSDIGKYASSIGASGWNPGFSEIRGDAVRRAQKAGLTVNPWTVNGEVLWRQALDYGVDGIITDDPEGLMKFLGRK